MKTRVFRVSEADDHLRLDVFLTKNLPDIPSRSFIQKLIINREVVVNNKQVKAHHRVSVNDEVVVCLPEHEGTTVVKPENIPLDIFYEDADLIIVNKPAGMTVHPAAGHHKGTLVNALAYHCKDLSDIASPLRPGIVHRLDQETSGLMIVAKNNAAHVKLARQFEKRLVKKRYIALVEGVVEFDEGVIDAALGPHPRHREKKAVVFYDAKEAKTFYRAVKRFARTTLVALFPQTGRTHQLRVHMAYLKHPILGDGKYGKKDSFHRLALHAQAIGFRHPSTSHYVEFSSVTPEDFLLVSAQEG